MLMISIGNGLVFRAVPQTVKKDLGGVGGLASPLTVIVSGGFAAGAGLSRLRREISLQIRRPGA